MGVFGGKGDVGVKGAFKRLSHSLSWGKKEADVSSDSESESEAQVDAMANSFVNEEDLRNFVPRGKADMSITGTNGENALNMDFDWEDLPHQDGNEEDSHLEGEAVEDPEHQKKKPSISIPTASGIDAANLAGEAVGEDLKVPPLNIVMLVCGTRGDVQPFIALGIKLKEYGHRVRLATHKDYRKFVEKYGLEFYPLGGDPKVLSDFIVKHRGVFTVNTKDAGANIDQVEDVVFSTYDAATKPDPDTEGAEPFTAQAIIANPPSYGHIHVAEKMQIPCHIYFTMPWTATRNFPHPLARIQNVRDTRPGSVAIRNYLSYLVVNEYTYTGLFFTFNKFRVEKLGLDPIRTGNSGAALLEYHDVPFCYCWSPSLVPKPDDWPKYVDVSGYFFLNEGSRGHYEPPKDLKDFLANGPAPVYLGFGSLMVDDREKLTQKILDAFKQTGDRLLLSKGWAELGEGFDLPETVLLLDDCPHDWLLPRCSAAIHHGGAGTTAASLLAACPTLVIPFFGDQTFWGSAVYRRGVGPKPIPIDSLTTKKLVTALKFMRNPDVKKEAEKVASLIKSEDGVQMGLEAFHRQLPVKDLVAGKPVEWKLSKPTLGSFLYEVGGGIADIFIEPYKGAKEEGVKGGIKGVGKGLYLAVKRPIIGAGLATYSVFSNVKKPERPMCFTVSRTNSEDEKHDATKAKLDQHGTESGTTGKDDLANVHSLEKGHPGIFKRTYSFHLSRRTKPVKDAHDGEEVTG